MELSSHIALTLRNLSNLSVICSFNIEKWLEDVVEVIQETTPIILVGNKVDLREEREVSFEEACEFAKNSNIMFMECSAKSGESVTEVFSVLGKSIKERMLDPKLKIEKEIKDRRI